MVTKQEFNVAAKEVAGNLMAYFQQLVGYKSYAQQAVLNVATPQEISDIRNSRINQGLIDKLARIAKRQWVSSGDAHSLYCAAMAVATIVKEYEWGTQYVSGEGLWEIANRIQNS